MCLLDQVRQVYCGICVGRILCIQRQQVEVLLHTLAMTDVGDEQSRLVLGRTPVSRLDGVLRIRDGRIDEQPAAIKRRNARTAVGIDHHCIEFLRCPRQERQAAEGAALRPNYQDTTLTHVASMLLHSVQLIVRH